MSTWPDGRVAVAPYPRLLPLERDRLGRNPDTLSAETRALVEPDRTLYIAERKGGYQHRRLVALPAYREQKRVPPRSGYSATMRTSARHKEADTESVIRCALWLCGIRTLFSFWPMISAMATSPATTLNPKYQRRIWTDHLLAQDTTEKLEAY